jgi:hypothetical protein
MISGVFGSLFHCFALWVVGISGDVFLVVASFHGRLFVFGHKII